jgi:hypothetical protein
MAGEAQRAREEAAEAMEAARRRWEEQATLLRQAAEAQVAQAREEATVAREALSSLSKSHGRAVAKLERTEAELEALQGGSSGTTRKGSSGKASKTCQLCQQGPRTRERRILELEREVEISREVVAELRRKCEDLQASPVDREARRHREAATLPAAKLRTSTGAKGFAEAPFEARTLEFIRRTVEESNSSLEGAATSNALLLQMHTGKLPDPERLFPRGSVTRAFKRLGVVDRETEAASNAKSKAFWALSSDAGNKGRAIQMMAISIWNATLGRPEVRPLGAADLFGDQSAKNGSLVHQAALKSAKYRPEYNVAGSLLWAYFWGVS